MPVFNFENYWVDWSFRPVNGSNIRDEPVSVASSASASASTPVFSGYFWIWLILAPILTVVTFRILERNMYKNTPYNAGGAVEDVPGSSQDNKSRWKHAGSLSATAVIRFLNIFRCKNPQISHYMC